MMANKFLLAYQCQDKLTQSLTEEEEQDLGPNDTLFKALDLPDYSGRLRSYGKGVSKKRLYAPRSNSTQAQVNNLYAITSALAKKVENLQGNDITGRQQPEKMVERQQPEKLVERQQPKKMVERQQPEKLVERQQPEKMVERPQPNETQQSVKDSYNPVDIDSIPKVIQNLCFFIIYPLDM
jgi:hypothetical protein